jgi:hypothetical protein
VDTQSVPQPTTRHHRVDHEFLGLLEEGFGIDFYSLNSAFMGVPSAPKKQAIQLCEWALRSAKGDPEEAGKALRAWAKKNSKGAYNRSLLEGPEATYEDNEHLRSVGRLEAVRLPLTDSSCQPRQEVHQALGTQSTNLLLTPPNLGGNGTGGSMTNHEPLTRLARELDPTKDAERDLPCFVHHPDAGGQCGRSATIEVYGLNFCEPHGEEIRIGASMQEHQDAIYFFDRFRNPHIPALDDRVDRELQATVTRLDGEMPTDEDHSRALRNAYPREAAPEQVREYVRAWEADRGPTTLDWSLDALSTIHKLMRIAHQDMAAWLVETLKYERQSVAAQAALAVDRYEEEFGSKS